MLHPFRSWLVSRYSLFFFFFFCRLVITDFIRTKGWSSTVSCININTVARASPWGGGGGGGGDRDPEEIR